MRDNVIITIKYENLEGDFEIPAKVPIKSCEDSLKSALKVQFPQLVFHGKKIRLKSREGYLRPEYSLEQYGIYDGTIIEMEIF